VIHNAAKKLALFVIVEVRARLRVPMRIVLDVKRVFACVCMIAARLAFACDQLPAGQSVWIRLTAPVSTYTAKAGDPVHAVLTQDLVCENDVLLPMGTPIDGVVVSKRKVGWGIRHETAALELEFNRAVPSPGIGVELDARVEEVENAREPVRKGVIQGIRSSDTFQGSINSRLIHLPTWNPYSDPVLIAYKAVFPIFPEPEIYYPAGTDIKLRTTDEISLLPMASSAVHESVPAAGVASDPLGRVVEQLPWRVTTRKDVDADLINIVFVGSENAVKSAFRVAGWQNADTVSKQTVLKNLYALLNKSGYSRQPMMTFYLNDKPEDMNWQKGLNGYDRRDHLRIWQWNSTEGTIWISSSTHDTGAALSVKHRGFVHHIAPAIDDERSTIIRDLDFAGCVSSVRYVARPEVPMSTRNAVGDVMHTDGLVAVVALQHCKPVEPQPDAGNARFRPGNYAFRFIRRQILTFRNDIVRANIIYGAYDVGRMTFVALHHPSPKAIERSSLAEAR
jgi:hypothetical protein